QAKVSRLLALARERGIVRITVADYDPRHPELEAALRRRLGLEEVTVVRTAGALAGGRTLQALVPHIPSDSARRPVVVQAMGSVEPAVSAHDAQEIGRVLARRLGGTFLALNAPAFIPEKRARDALLQLEQVREVQGRLARARLALVGIGTLANSVFVERGTLSGEMLRELQRAGAVGEICGRFFDARGRECATPWRDRVISVGLPQLRRIPLVVAVVTGADRAAALLAAVRSGLVKGLVADEACAAALAEAAG
ncbi:MAG: hypothetical protein RLZZ188_2864, partial [Verrucomicrobiota bacterium]